MRNRERHSTALREIREKNNVVLNEETFIDYNPLDLMPATIDRDYGFFMMFGNPDNHIPGKASDNYDSSRSV
jgi:hypothetical protein